MINPCQDIKGISWPIKIMKGKTGGEFFELTEKKSFAIAKYNLASPPIIWINSGL